MIELLIFDLDGVLVDTQDAEIGALASLARRVGLPFTVEECYQRFGARQLQACLDEMAELVGMMPPDAMEFVRAECRRRIGDRDIAVPGALHILSVLDTPKCVASNSPVDIVAERLARAGMDHLFEQTFSAYAIGSWKPDAGLFLHAAAAYAVPPGNCVVIEDSQAGVAAALAAGMHVIQYAGGGEALPGCQRVIFQFEDLTSSLSQISSEMERAR